MKKNILFIESRYDSFYGAQKSMLQLIKGLDSENFSYNIVTTGEGQLKKGLESNDIPVDVIKLGRKANVFGGEVLKYSLIEKVIVLIHIFLFNLKLIKYILSNKNDIIYVNDIRALLYSIIAAKLTRKKVVWYIRADVANSILTRIGLICSNQVITIARGVLRNLPEKTTDKYKSKITNIYTGFDFELHTAKDQFVAKSKLDISVDKFVIGYLGSINERKGLDLLIEVFIEVYRKNSKTHLLIVGNISEGYNNYWEFLLDKLNKSGVSYTYLPYTDNISDIYNAMDVFVLPSKSEGLPRVLIEAMGHKVPVISTDVGGVKEIIISKKYGSIVNEDNVKNNMIRELCDLYRDSDKRLAISRNGNRFVLAEFSKENFEEKINVFFKEKL